MTDQRFAYSAGPAAANERSGGRPTAPANWGSGFGDASRRHGVYAGRSTPVVEKRLEFIDGDDDGDEYLRSHERRSGSGLRFRGAAPRGATPLPSAIPRRSGFAPRDGDDQRATAARWQPQPYDAHQQYPDGPAAAAVGTPSGLAYRGSGYGRGSRKRAMTELVLSPEPADARYDDPYYSGAHFATKRQRHQSPSTGPRVGMGRGGGRAHSSSGHQAGHTPYPSSHQRAMYAAERGDVDAYEHDEEDEEEEVALGEDWGMDDDSLYYAEPDDVVHASRSRPTPVAAKPSKKRSGTHAAATTAAGMSTAGACPHLLLSLACALCECVWLFERVPCAVCIRQRNLVEIITIVTCPVHFFVVPLAPSDDDMTGDAPRSQQRARRKSQKVSWAEGDDDDTPSSKPLPLPQQDRSHSHGGGDVAAAAAPKRSRSQQEFSDEVVPATSKAVSGSKGDGVVDTTSGGSKRPAPLQEQDRVVGRDANAVSPLPVPSPVDSGVQTSPFLSPLATAPALPEGGEGGHGKRMPARSPMKVACCAIAIAAFPCHLLARSKPWPCMCVAVWLTAGSPCVHAAHP
jgi:hypothetical protein